MIKQLHQKNDSTWNVPGQENSRVPQLTANPNDGSGPTLFDIAKKMQWTFPEVFGEDWFLVILGGLHIQMALWATMGFPTRVWMT